MATKKIYEVEIQSKTAQQETAKLTAQLKAQKDELAKVRQSWKAGELSLEQYGKEEAKVQNEIRQTNKDLRVQRKLVDSAATSLNGMRAKLIQLKKEYGEVNQATATGAKRFRQLQREISTLNAKISKQEQAVGVYSRNVGAYQKGIVGAFRKIGAGVSAAFVPVAGAIATVQQVGARVQEVLNLADQQLQAEAQLLNAAKGNVEVQERLLKLAQDRQKVTLFGDEATADAQSYALALTQNSEATFQLTARIQDLAAAKKIPLRNAAELIAKTFASSTNALSRYGIQVEGTAGSTERLESVTQALDRAFGGAAETAAKTGLGPLKQLQNVIGDLQERIGMALLPVITEFSNYLLGDFAKSMAEAQRGAETLLNIFSAMLSPIVKVGKALGIIDEKTTNLSYAMRILGDAINNAIGINGLRIIGKISDAIERLIGRVQSFAQRFGGGLLNLSGNTAEVDPLSEKRQAIAQLRAQIAARRAALEETKQERVEVARVQGVSIGKAQAVGIADGLRESRQLIAQAMRELAGGKDIDVSAADNYDPHNINPGAAFFGGMAAIAEDQVNKSIEQLHRFEAEMRASAEREQRIQQGRIQAFAGVGSFLTNLSSTFKEESKAQQAFMIAGAMTETTANYVRELSQIAATWAAFPPIAAALKALATLNFGANITRLRSLHTGGYTSNEGMPDPNVPGRRIVGVVHDNEYVVPTHVLNTPEGAALAARLEGLRGFQDGGYTSRQITSAGLNEASLIRMLDDVFARMPSPVVAVEEINKGQRNLVKVESNGNF